MTLSVKEEGEFHIIAIYGDVDAASSINLDKAILKAVSEGKRNLLIDGSHLNYISSAGLGVFMSYLEDFKEKKILMVIFGLSEKVKKIFEILGLDKLMIIVSSKEEAKKLRNDPLL